MSNSYTFATFQTKMQEWKESLGKQCSVRRINTERQTFHHNNASISELVRITVMYSCAYGQ